MTVAMTDAIAEDGRPVITLEEVARQGPGLVLRGTSCVWEATLHLRFADGHVATITSTVGAPDRGEWSAYLGQHLMDNLVSIAPMLDSETSPDRATAMTLNVAGKL